MAVNGDESLLPTPPPPRPAARQAAVEAALRRFDGSEETSIGAQERKLPSPGWWAGIGRRPAGALVTAALIAVIGIPTAMIALRDQTIAPRANEPAAAQAEQNATADSLPPTASVQAGPPTDQPIAAEPPGPPSKPSASEPMSFAPAARNASPADELEAFDQAPAPMATPAPAPPPPPPAPPAPQVAEEAGTQEIVLTGTRVARSDMQKQREKRERLGAAASPDSNGDFLSRLQSAVRANDKRTLVRLVGLPLRVNFDEGPKTYGDRKSIERDFDLIFTSRVRQSILDQRAEQLFTNYQGAMVGAGEVWFDESCANSTCSQKGPVRIRAINP